MSIDRFLRRFAGVSFFASLLGLAITHIGGLPFQYAVMALFASLGLAIASGAIQGIQTRAINFRTSVVERDISPLPFWMLFMLSVLFSLACFVAAAAALWRTL